MALFREIKVSPRSMTEISTRLHRDRSAVKIDIDELARAGLVVVEERPQPGHGRRKEARAVAQHVVLSAVM